MKEVERNFLHRLVEIITGTTNSEIIASLNYAFIAQNQASSLRQRAAHEKRDRQRRGRKEKAKNYDPFQFMQRNLGKRSFSCSLTPAPTEKRTLLILIRLIAICFVSFLVVRRSAKQNPSHFIQLWPISTAILSAKMQTQPRM